MDLGAQYTYKETVKLEKKITEIYKQAKSDLEKKLEDFNKKYAAKEAIHLKELQDKKITYEEYSNWVDGQIFQSKQWQSKIDQVTRTLYSSNDVATKIINGSMSDVFSFNGNYAAYSLEHGAGVNFGFELYDQTTVVNLIINDPQILPKWRINEKKDYIWNKKKVNNAITQGIIQGEKLDDITKRISDGLCAQNENLMKTFARTGMTQAQNSGRYQRQMEAKKKGIEVYKEWMATLDGRTRDSHASLDGEKQKVGDQWHPFKFSNGCRYPGDPQGAPREVYNCRCTLVSDVETYPSEYERYDNIEGKPIKNMTYKEWVESKKGAKVTSDKDYENAVKKLEDINKKIVAVGADKVFKDIWKDQYVTYADWEDKKYTIEAKKQFYEAQIKNYKKEFWDEIVPSDEEGEELFNLLAKHQSLTSAHKDEDLIKFFSEIDLDEDDLDDVWAMFSGARKKIINTGELLDQLEEFKKNGEAYSKLLAERDAAKQLVKDLKPKPEIGNMFNAEAYSQARKDAAIWAKSGKEADSYFRQATKDVWKDATEDEKYAAWDYTSASGGFNRPLRGYEGSWKNFKGIGEVDPNYEGKGKEIEELTDLLSRSKLQQDTWLQRGIETYDGAASFLQVDEAILRNASQEELEQLLLDKEVQDLAFMSCGSARGTGFDGTILNIYCPEGTQALYVEPFSRYGDGAGKNWDGISDQNSFGYELETLLQRGSRFRITKVERKNGNIYIDMDVIGQDY